MSDGILVQALGDFCKRYLGDSAVVVRGYVNRVSKPKTKSYVLVTPMTMTRFCNASGVSPGCTATAFCSRIGPPSHSSLTRWTVAPVSLTPRASAAS